MLILSYSIYVQAEIMIKSFAELPNKQTNISTNDVRKRRERNRKLIINPNNPAHLYLNSLRSAKSKKTMERALDAIALFLGKETNSESIKYMDDIPWCEIQRHHVHNIVNSLSDQGKSPSTVALYLSAIKGVMKEAWLSKMIEPDQYHRIFQVKKPAGSRVRKGKALDLGDVNKTVDTCDDDTITGVRDKAIISVLLGAGLRREECANLQLSDIEFGLNTINVIGKGNKQRVLPVEDTVMDSIFEWVDGVRGEHQGPLFLPIRKNGNIGETALSDTSIYQICIKRGYEAGIENLKPHNLRRTYGTEHDKAGTDLQTTSDLLGHESLDTTRTYIFDDKETKKQSAVKKVSMFKKS